MPPDLLRSLIPQLSQEAHNIYHEFLSSQALSPVNIDRQAWLSEEVLAQPRPDMFRAQQLQVREPRGKDRLRRETSETLNRRRHGQSPSKTGAKLMQNQSQMQGQGRRKRVKAVVTEGWTGRGQE